MFLDFMVRLARYLVVSDCTLGDTRGLRLLSSANLLSLEINEVSPPPLSSTLLC